MFSFFYFVDRCLSFFFWPLRCISFFDLRLLITPSVSSNSSKINLDQLFDIYIIMWSCPGNMAKYYPGLRDILADRRVICLSDLGNILAYYLDKTRVICLSDLGNILAYYLDKTTLISLLYWASNCPGNMSKYYGIPNITTETYTKYNNCLYCNLCISFLDMLLLHLETAYCMIRRKSNTKVKLT